MDEPVEIFVRDAAAYTDEPFYLGFMSLLSLAAWTATATLSAFIAWIEPRTRVRLVLLAVLTAVLGADDSLLLHEAVSPKFGVHEVVPYAIYAVLGLALAWQFSPLRTRGAGVAYFLGGTFLASSIVTDQRSVDLWLLEEGLKLLGVLTWIAVPLLTHAALDRHGPLGEGAAATADRRAAAG